MTRLIFTAGGTGGHIFPSIALAEELKNNFGCSILFAGGKLSSNPYFPKQDFESIDIACSGHLLRGAKTNLKGVFEAVSAIGRFNPDAVIGFGSYYTLPVLMGSLFLKKPLLLHEANSIPGRVNRIFSPFAKKTWIFFEDAKKHLKGNVEISKMPLRKQFKKGLISKSDALQYFQLKQAPTLLVFGGSQGARRLNAIFKSNFPSLLKKKIPNLQILHFTGSDEDEKALNDNYRFYGIPSCVKSFETRIDLAWEACDIALTRAGASSIAERYEYQKNGVLIPFPNATDNHQEHNADHVVRKGLGIKLLEKEITEESLLDALMQSMQAEKKIENEHANLSELIMEWVKK